MNDIVIQKIEKQNINSVSELKERLPELIQDMSIMNDNDIAENFTAIMSRARKLNIEDDVYTEAQLFANSIKMPELWEKLLPFEKDTQLKSFPVDVLPETLRDYVKSVSEFVQVSADMVAVYMLSVLSLCLQGKAVISHMNTQHTETLNLYIAVIAKPAERKTGVYSLLMKPVVEYEKNKNESLKREINAYKDKKRTLEKQLEKHMNKGDLNNVQKVRKDLEDLVPITNVRYNVTDATSEALASYMEENGGRMGILTAEGGIFETIAGRYSNGVPNMDLYLNAYDGSPVSILRRSGDIRLDNPLLTMGFLVQHDVIQGVLNNTAFVGRGFVQRFLLAFPQSKVGERKAIGKDLNIPAQKKYNELIEKLLKMEYPEKSIPVLGMDEQACALFEEFFNGIEKELKQEGKLYSSPALAEWGGKLCGKVLRIAGILHLCSHSIKERINKETVYSAALIANYFIHHSKHAFEVMGAAENNQNALYIISKLREKGQPILTLRELQRLCRKFKTSEELTEILELLEDFNYIKTETKQNCKGKPTTIIKINPAVF